MIPMILDLPFSRFVKLLLMALLLVGCSNERVSDEQWPHSDLSSYAAVFSPDGKYVLVGDTDAPARLWDIEANKVLYSWQNNEEVGTTTAVGFSGDGKVAATSEQDVIVLWEVATGKPMLRLSFPVKIKALALSQQGDYLLLALYDRTAVYFDVIKNRVIQILEHDGKAVNSPINQLINAVAISPSGKYGLTGGDDQTARLWKLETGEQIRSWKHENLVNIVAFYPKGGFVLTGAGNGQTHFWNMVTGEEQYTLRTSAWPKDKPLPNFPSFKTTTSAIAFSPDNTYLVTGHPSQKICLWAVATGDNIDCWQVARKQALRPGVVIQALAFSPDGKAIYSESGNGIGQKWLIK
jgi:WD40 repeat protein